MSAKVSKTLKRDIITQFFMEKGQRMSNLTRVDDAKLDSIITKYNIDVEGYRQFLSDKAKKDLKEKKEREELSKIKHEEELRIIKEKADAEEAEMNRLWSSITQKEKLWVCERLTSQVNKERQKNNEFAIKMTDVMEADFKKNGALIYRESPNELRVNGIMVSNSYIEKMLTSDEVLELMPSHLRWYKNSVNDIEFLTERKLTKGKKIEFIIKDEEETK